MERVAIVTGSARGIGEAYARHLAASGHRIVIADRDEDRATETAERLAGEGATTLAVGVDVADPEQVEAMVERTVGEFGRLDVLVNNAALFGADIEFNPNDWDPLEGSLEQYRRAMAVNVDSIVYCCRAAAPAMRANGWGRIVNQATAAVYFENATLYVLTKLAVVNITRLYAQALGKFGVTVNAISPGITVSESILNRFPTEEQARQYLDGFAGQHTALGRPASVDDLARALAFLVSDEAEYITAQNLVVDGGWVNRI